MLAAAGVDASNVSRDEIALLPADPDASAAALRKAFEQRLGVEVGVVVCDSLGRAWRAGIIDQALGVSGVTAVQRPARHRRRHGNVLNVTVVAVADEIASAADLVKGKLSAVPVAVVRGLDRWLDDDGTGSRPLVRSGPPTTCSGWAPTRRWPSVARTAPARRRRPVRCTRTRSPSWPRCPMPASPRTPLREAFVGHLLARPDAVWRSCVSGHLTASTVMLDPSAERCC